ncbi:unnamed protein product [Arabis nemorensis]|uniref:Uncharacterized protein n=1 Tax=Arabis nemorensis TaxID=586526 RepID=A0A565CGG5_9BRAS|nr:unnamed protein product [Arabis nemorensis]
MIRKENRRPVNSNLLPRRTELTPPPTKSRNAAVFAGSASSMRGTISASAGENKSKGVMGMARKSYATVEDLKKSPWLLLSPSTAAEEEEENQSAVVGLFWVTIKFTDSSTLWL